MLSPRLFFLVPGRLDTRTGGYEYDRRMIAGLRARAWTVEVRELDTSFPHPSERALACADALLAAIEDDALVVIDGLAAGAMPTEIERHASRLRIVPLVHALLASEVGLDRETANKLEASERRALAYAAHVIAVGPSLIAPLGRYGVPSSRIAVVEPGTDAAPLARGSRHTGILHFVTVATLNRGKGHHVLFDALAKIPDGWRLTCAGSTTRQPETTSQLKSQLSALQLTERVTLAGELDAQAIAALYDSADLFVLPTLSETHPLSVAEALARGLPLVCTTVGAIPDLVGSGDDAAALLVGPGNVDALAAALTRVLTDTACLGRLANGARRVRARLRTWDASGRECAEALARIAVNPR